MGILKSLKEDLKAIFPDGIKIYDNKITGEFAFEVINKPNQYVPRIVRHYENRKIQLTEATNTPSSIMENFFKSKQKCLELKKDL